MDGSVDDLFDMDVGPYIYSVHRLKMVLAVRKLLPLVSPDAGRILAAALNRFLTARVRQHHVERTVRQALATVSREG